MEKQPSLDISCSEPGKSVPHLRRNYWFLALEGSLFGAGLTFVNATTILPTIAKSLGCPVWLISLMPVMMMIGYRVPPVFTAHYIETLPRFKPFITTTALIQRIPFAVAGIVMILMPQATFAALIAVVITPLISGIFGGASVTAWAQLVANCIPQERRNSLFAVRAAISCILGMAVGKAVQEILKHWPGVFGYGLLHLFAFVLMMGSFCAFTLSREVPRTNPPSQRSPSLLENLKTFPSLVAGDRDFLLLLISRLFRNGLGIIMPFLAIHCHSVTKTPDSFLGNLVIVQMIGSILGNVLAGWMGDRFGGKGIYLLGSAILVGMSLWAINAHSAFEWQCLFFVFGFGLSSSEVSNQTLGLEMGSPEKRASYLSIAAVANLPAMLLASWISAYFWRNDSGFFLLAIFTIACVLASMASIIPMQENHVKGTHANPEDPEIGTI